LAEFLADCASGRLNRRSVGECALADSVGDCDGGGEEARERRESDQTGLVAVLFGNIGPGIENRSFSKPDRLVFPQLPKVVNWIGPSTSPELLFTHKANGAVIKFALFTEAKAV
jgi:hypothetical protein